MVLRGSAALKNPEISVVPFAKAPIITARWEMDLSPGTLISPRNPDEGLMVLFICSSVRRL